MLRQDPFATLRVLKFLGRLRILLHSSFEQTSNIWNAKNYTTILNKMKFDPIRIERKLSANPGLNLSKI